MCLATPTKIKSKVPAQGWSASGGKNKSNKVIVDGGKEVDITLTPDAKVGDWLLCHADLAVQKISESQAMEVLELNKVCHHH